jgi:hypothetical protein
MKMLSTTWAIRFTDKDGQVLTTEMESWAEPTLEQAAGVVVQLLRGLTVHPETIDIAPDDPMPNLSTLACFNYEIVDIKAVNDPD